MYAKPWTEPNASYCSANPTGQDECTNMLPFYTFKERHRDVWKDAKNKILQVKRMTKHKVPVAALSGSEYRKKRGLKLPPMASPTPTVSASNSIKVSEMTDVPQAKILFLPTSINPRTMHAPKEAKRGRSQENGASI